jgi:hypothetical protein
MRTVLRAQVSFLKAPGITIVIGVASLLMLACGRTSGPRAHAPPAGPDLGVNPAEMSPKVDNPYVALATVRHAIYEGEEPEGNKVMRVRVESTVRDSPETVAGIRVTAVDVSDYEAGELVERTIDYYAQHRSGDVYYVGERVEDYEGGKVVGHGGQWLAGEHGNHAGVFMPANPRVGDVFEQERAPGIAEDRSTVIAIGVTATTPAGTFRDCVETEDFDPISKTTMRKLTCRGVGLVRETYRAGHKLELVKFEPR